MLRARDVRVHEGRAVLTCKLSSNGRHRSRKWRFCDTWVNICTQEVSEAHRKSRHAPCPCFTVRPQLHEQTKLGPATTQGQNQVTWSLVPDPCRTHSAPPGELYTKAWTWCEPRTSHSLKTFLIRHGVSGERVGWNVQREGKRSTFLYSCSLQAHLQLYTTTHKNIHTISECWSRRAFAFLTHELTDKRRKR